MEKIHILAIGFGTEEQALIRDIVGNCVVTNIPMTTTAIMQAVTPPPGIVLCGSVPVGIQLAEIAQLTRLLYQTQPIYLAGRPRADHNRNLLTRYGFTDVFLLPVEAALFKKTLTDTFANLRQGETKTYHPVKLVDIQPGTTLDFDTFIYLPFNDRYIHYSNAGDPIDAAHTEQLIDHKMGTIYIKSDQIQAFYRYTSRLVDRPDSKHLLGITQRKTQLVTAVREFLSATLANQQTITLKKGQETIENCQELVKAFIFDMEKGDWYLPLFDWAGEPFEIFRHTANVALYAAIFSAALGYKNPEDVAVAGIFHDAALLTMPLDAQIKPETDWTAQERADYGRHAETAVNFIRSQRINISDKAIKIIHQYNNCFNNPVAQANQIIPEAQLLALADQIDYRISVRPGKLLVSPLEALRAIKQEALDQTSRIAVSPMLTDMLLEIFPKGVFKHIEGK